VSAPWPPRFYGHGIALAAFMGGCGGKPVAVIRTAAGMPAAVLRSLREKTAELDRIEG